MIKRKEHKKPYWWWKQRKPSKLTNGELMAVLRKEMQKLRAYSIDTHKGDEV